MFLFIRGLPAAGKSSVAKELEKKFSWKVVSLHAFKDVIFAIIPRWEMSKLMQRILEPVLEFVMQENENVIFVRPATKQDTVARIKRLVKKFPQYDFHLVGLVGDQKELTKRAIKRADPHRIDSVARMQEYLSRSGKFIPFKDELVIDTTKLTIKQVADTIAHHFGYKQ